MSIKGDEIAHRVSACLALFGEVVLLAWFLVAQGVALRESPSLGAVAALMAVILALWSATLAGESARNVIAVWTKGNTLLYRIVGILALVVPAIVLLYFVLEWGIGLATGVQYSRQIEGASLFLAALLAGVFLVGGYYAAAPSQE